jgi:hypothetical protein
VNRTESSGSTLPLTLDLSGLTATMSAHGPRVGASAEKHSHLAGDPADVWSLRPDLVSAVRRACRPDFPR